MSLFIADNFETLKSYFNDILFLITNANNNLIWEGKARENFNENTKLLENAFQELFHENLKLESEYEYIKTNANSFLMR